MTLIHGKPLLPHRRFKQVIPLVIVGPIIEEFLFRYPIVILAHRNEIIPAYMLACILGVLFGVVHKNEILCEFKYGVEIKYTFECCLFLAIMGVFLGIISVIAVSLWPAIIIHSLVNLHFWLTGNVDQD